MSPETLAITNTREAINKLPTTTGIYIYLAGKEIIYIGKSVSLKARLLSHMENAKIDAKEAGIVNNADTIRCIITDSEFKALLLESQLISKHKPKYNVRWRDDKSYLYIKVTVKETYPKFYLTRREYDKKALYFGPFPSVRVATNLLREIRKVFPFCTQRKITKQQCFYSKIGLCNPCPNVIEALASSRRKSGSQEIPDQVRDDKIIKMLTREYRHNIRQAIKVLEGQTDLVLNNLYKELKIQTETLNYENAIQTRNRIFRLEGLIQGKRLDPDELGDYNKSGENVIKLRELLNRFWPDLKNLNRIECFDISNTSQKEGTASMVVFTDGLIDKKEYRRFKTKDLTLHSDFDMMNEVLRRRFKRSLKQRHSDESRNLNEIPNHPPAGGRDDEESDDKKWALPNLLVVDGGKPQVRIAQQVLSDLHLNIPLIGIAKRPDRLVIGNHDLQMVRPQLNHPGFNLIRALRDESHRFAKKYHVLLREKKMML